MDELLGFVVLSGPLFLIVLWLPICILAARLISKRYTWGGHSFVRGLVVFTIMFMLPFTDEIVGQIYLHNLCATQTDFKVYQTVELPAEYWSSDGEPSYLASNGFVDLKLLPGRYEWNNIDEPYIDFLIKITKSRWQLIDEDSNTVVGERITYMRRYGWLNRFTTAPNIGEGCKYSGGQKDSEQEKEFFKDIFKPITLTQ